MSQSPKILGLWKHEPESRTVSPLKTWARIQNCWSSENMSQDPELLVLWKHEPKPKKPWSSENMNQDPKILGLWKHEPRSKNPKSLKTWARIQNLWASENMSQSPKILGLLKTWARIRRPPGKHILYSLKKKIKKFACMNYVWTWSPHQEVRRQSPSRFGPYFDPLHDHLHFYLHASYIHNG